MIIIIGVLPFVFREKTDSINQTLNLSATIVSSLAAVATLSIALLLFNKYGIDSSLIDKNSTKVFELLEQIKAIRFSFETKEHWFNIGMSDPFKNNEFIENYYQEKLIFSETYYNSLRRVFELNDSPFMPTVIVEKIERLQPYLMSFDVDQGTQGDYYKVLVMGDSKIPETKFGRFNGEDISLFEFLNILNDINDVVQKWVRSNSSSQVKLNL